MDNVLADVRWVKERVVRLATMVDMEMSSAKATPHKTNWTEYRSLIGELEDGLQHVERRAEVCATHGEAGAASAAPPPQTPTPDYAPADSPPSSENRHSEVLLSTSDDAPDEGPSSSETRPAEILPSTSDNASDEGPPSSETRPAEIPPSTAGERPNQCHDLCDGVIIIEQRARKIVTRTQKTSTLSSQAPNAGATIAPPSPPDQPLPGTTIPHREEDGVIVLLPSPEQCKDLPLLISRAKELGAYDTGVFKYVLPDAVVRGLRPILNLPPGVSKFKSRPYKKHSRYIARSEREDEVLDLGELDFTPIPHDEYVETLERRVTDRQAMNKMQYLTDLAAWTPGDRENLGLPPISPIYPLQHNELDRTRRFIAGVHAPYGYISGGHGSLFSSHREDGYLLSLNALYEGLKLWYIVARMHSHLIEEAVKKRKCMQKVRHASLWFSTSQLKAMGVSFVTMVQRPNEVVVVSGDIYHHGGTLGYSRAEAVNYAPPGWSIDGYSECKRKCPGFPIPNEYLEFRAPGEIQLGLPLADEEDEPESNENFRSPQKRRRGPASAASSGGKRRCTAAGSNLPAQKIAETTPILQMAKSICSSAAVEQLFKVVRGGRLFGLTLLRKMKGSSA
ncbi:hypothetical protein Z517_09429 [Fonsecaea pedrosoi CBS 271.37]|uniref:JmjC domain-containing protein n=1 Tax=Fonsecaea pedrosoi CBS 271.37 TaxID=1442368 RepID=A0A0D2GEE0_9EURO|nr:uncharacterized protein Z517_09429 [Fonsecaea pedrosoi CBS 271.37]KIW76985.1 hypothetical protein Z517_09429 [Fonsecaea pedrosoi CBS 271.37]